MAIDDGILQKVRDWYEAYHARQQITWVQCIANIKRAFSNYIPLLDSVEFNALKNDNSDLSNQYQSQVSELCHMDEVPYYQYAMIGPFKLCSDRSGIDSLMHHICNCLDSNRVPINPGQPCMYNHLTPIRTAVCYNPDDLTKNDGSFLNKQGRPCEKSGGYSLGNNLLLPVGIFLGSFLYQSRISSKLMKM